MFRRARRRSSITGAMDQDLLDWIRRQSATCRVTFPERLPGEPDATSEQLDEIRQLGESSDPPKELQLGTWQAAYLILRLREERRDLEARATAAAQAVQGQRDANGCAWVVLGMAVLVAIGIILRTCG